LHYVYCVISVRAWSHGIPFSQTDGSIYHSDTPIAKEYIVYS